METDRLLAAVMEIMVGAASGVGSGVGTAVAELVRERLTAGDEGRTALTGIADNPSDATTIAALRALLERELEADGQFRDRLVGALAGPPPPEQPLDPPHTTAHSVVISGSNRLRNSQISLGPLTINNTRSAKATIVAVVALFGALVLLASYGMVRLVGDDGSAAAGTGGDGDAKTLDVARSSTPSAGMTGPTGAASSDACVAAGGRPPLQTPVGGRVGANPCVLPVGATFTYADGVTVKVSGFKVVEGGRLDGEDLSLREGEEAFIVKETVSNGSTTPVDLFQFSYDSTISASTGEQVETVDSTGLDGTLAPGATKTRRLVKSIKPADSGTEVRFTIAREWADSDGHSPYDLAWVGTVS